MNWLRNLLGKVPAGVLSGITVAVILWLTLAPHPTGDLDLPLFPGADKIVHAVMFGFLTFIILLEMMKHRKWVMLPLPLIGLVSILTALLGVGIEFAQRAMGMGRELEILDMIADGAGSATGGAIWAAVQKLFIIDD